MSEFKSKEGYFHSRVISLTKGIDKRELKGWEWGGDLPCIPGIYKITVWKPSKDIFIIIRSERVYDIELEKL